MEYQPALIEVRGPCVHVARGVRLSLSLSLYIYLYIPRLCSPFSGTRPLCGALGRQD